ncbi:hypothetical protein COL940_005096 [Colletotrichum noveboracense]|nr:hypothetical protein COL940_005096 [Colletotrichum noveboracense]
MAALPAFGGPSLVQLSEILDRSLDTRLGRDLSSTPANLSRVVYIPRHRDITVHLPLYDVSNTYFDAVKKEPIGSSKYKLNLAMMRRPSGDGTDAEVRYLVDFQEDAKEKTVVVERRVPTHNGEVVGIADAQPSNLEWQTCPKEHGALRYTLVDTSVEPTDGKPVVHAIYHHAGIAFALPHDYSEGVLLLSEDLNDEAEALAVTTLLGLLERVRQVNQPAPRPRKKSLVKRVLGKI